MVSTILVVAALSSGHKLGLALVGAAFIVYALICSFVLPRSNPNFPGKGMPWFVLVSVLFFVAMVSAVLVFGKESKGAEAAKPPSQPAQTTTAATTTTATTTAAPPAAQGDAVAGKKVFADAGCGGCHTLAAAGSTGTVGPNLDQLRPPLARIVTQVENGGGPMPAFKNQLSQKQIQDVAAYVFQSTR
jgi:mono/diheme cytochrome c family protein